jgi:hypothetical protein
LILYAAAASGKQQDDYEGQWSEEEWEAYFEFVRTSCGTDEYAHSTLREFAPSHVDDGRIGAWCTSGRGSRPRPMPRSCGVSSTVKDLTVGSGIVFEDAGEHELKGVPDPWHLYRVVG